jgi:hypothetical protein
MLSSIGSGVRYRIPLRWEISAPTSACRARTTDEHELVELRAARDFIAILVADNALLDPLFDRLEREIEIEVAKLSVDPVDRARALVSARRNV